MQTAEFIAMLLRHGYAVSPIGCVAVLRENYLALPTHPAIPEPKLGVRYAYWPEYEFNDTDEAVYAEACRLVNEAGVVVI